MTKQIVFCPWSGLNGERISALGVDSSLYLMSGIVAPSLDTSVVA